MKSFDRKQMMEERKSLMQEFRQVRRAMTLGKDKKGEREKNDVDPREVLMEIRNRMAGRKEESPTVITNIVVLADSRSDVAIPLTGMP